MINSPLVYRYAHAFFNVFQDKFTQTSIAALKKAITYLKAHQSSIALLQLAHSAPQVKERALLDSLAQLGIDATLLQPLIHVLITDKRISLLVAILEQLPTLYYEHNAMELFTVRSTEPLTSEQKVWITNFLANATGKKIILNPIIDRSLIAGLRILSENLYFEKSVRACLNQLRTQQI